jgi:glutamine synthetase
MNARRLDYSSHIHVSLRDQTGKNIFAISEEELNSGGRSDCKYGDLKYVSQTCEWFLGGILDGITDGKRLSIIDNSTH